MLKRPPGAGKPLPLTAVPSSEISVLFSNLIYPGVHDSRNETVDALSPFPIAQGQGVFTEDCYRDGMAAFRGGCFPLGSRRTRG